jgi:hypothetical protein
MEQFKKLSRAEMKNVKGGVQQPPGGGGGGGGGGCYQCCTPDLSLCGHCDTSGNGECEGEGVVYKCVCF